LEWVGFGSPTAFTWVHLPGEGAYMTRFGDPGFLTVPPHLGSCTALATLHLGFLHFLGPLSAQDLCLLCGSASHFCHPALRCLLLLHHTGLHCLTHLHFYPTLRATYHLPCATPTPHTRTLHCCATCLPASPRLHHLPSYHMGDPPPPPASCLHTTPHYPALLPLYTCLHTTLHTGIPGFPGFSLTIHHHQHCPAPLGFHYHTTIVALHLLPFHLTYSAPAVYTGSPAHHTGLLPGSALHHLHSHTLFLLSHTHLTTWTHSLTHSPSRLTASSLRSFPAMQHARGGSLNHTSALCPACHLPTPTLHWVFHTP